MEGAERVSQGPGRHRIARLSSHRSFWRKQADGSVAGTEVSLVGPGFRVMPPSLSIPWGCSVVGQWHPRAALCWGGKRWVVIEARGHTDTICHSEGR